MHFYFHVVYLTLTFNSWQVRLLFSKLSISWFCH